MVPDVYSVCFSPITEMFPVIIEAVFSVFISIVVGCIKPFTPEFFPRVFCFGLFKIAYIPGTVKLPVLFSIWYVRSPANCCRSLPFTKFAVWIFDMDNRTFPVLIASAHTKPPYNNVVQVFTPDRFLLYFLCSAYVCPTQRSDQHTFSGRRSAYPACSAKDSSCSAAYVQGWPRSP